VAPPLTQTPEAANPTRAKPTRTHRHARHLPPVLRWTS
jgi:hypothetical protein